jgi:7-keto-8-aminopelargonate synthetase-like enzyme
LVVDDSHGLGVTGHEGAGIYRRLASFSQVQPVVIASLGKALSLPGGLILADADTINYIRGQGYFGGASPMAPAYLHAFLQAAPLYDEARTRLLANIRQFSHNAGPTGLFRHLPHYPVFYTSADGLYDFLRDRQILISCFPYPTPSNAPLTRVILSSLHETADVAYLGQCIREFDKES